MKKFLFSILLSSFLLTVESEARINFLHIPKCGGTTIRIQLSKNFDGNVYPRHKLGGNRIGTYLPNVAKEILKTFPNIEHEFVAGHFPIWFLKKKDSDFDHSFFFTVLREPVSRVISSWVYSKRVSPLAGQPNTMCKMLCSDVTLTGNELLQDAIENLKRMDFIIFQDDYENGLLKLVSILNLKLFMQHDYVANKRNSQARRDELSEEVIEKIKELNSLDIQLYEYAEKHLRDKFR